MEKKIKVADTNRTAWYHTCYDADATVIPPDF